MKPLSLFRKNLGFFSPVIRRRQWQPTPVLLPGKPHGRRSLVGCSPWGREESDMTGRLHFHFSLSCIGEGNGNPVLPLPFSSVLAWRIPVTGEPGGPPSMGSHRVGHDWSNLAAAAAATVIRGAIWSTISKKTLPPNYLNYKEREQKHKTILSFQITDQIMSMNYELGPTSVPNLRWYEYPFNIPLKKVKNSYQGEPRNKYKRYWKRLFWWYISPEILNFTVLYREQIN